MSVVCVTRGGHRVNIREVTFRPGFSIWSMASCAKIKFCIDRRESFPLSASHVTSSVLPFFFFFFMSVLEVLVRTFWKKKKEPSHFCAKLDCAGGQKFLLLVHCLHALGPAPALPNADILHIYR